MLLLGKHVLTMATLGVVACSAASTAGGGGVGVPSGGARVAVVPVMTMVLRRRNRASCSSREPHRTLCPAGTWSRRLPTANCGLGWGGMRVVFWGGGVKDGGCWLAVLCGCGVLDMHTHRQMHVHS